SAGSTFGPGLGGSCFPRMPGGPNPPLGKPPGPPRRAMNSRAALRSSALSRPSPSLSKSLRIFRVWPNGPLNPTLPNGPPFSNSFFPGPGWPAPFWGAARTRMPSSVADRAAQIRVVIGAPVGTGGAGCDDQPIVYRLYCPAQAPVDLISSRPVHPTFSLFDGGNDRAGR